MTMIETTNTMTENTMTDLDWRDAVMKGLVGLGDVPEVCRTYGVCREALWVSGAELEFVPNDIYEWIGNWNLRMILGRSGRLLKFIPETLRDYDLCDVAVAADGTSLEFVPERHKCLGLCLMAVRGNPLALEFVPETFREAWLCRLAVKTTPEAFGFVPESLKSLEICHWACRRGVLPVGVPSRYRRLLKRLIAAPGRLRPGSLPPERLPR